MQKQHTNNREYGVGTVHSGTVEGLAQGGYYVDIASTVGHRFMSEVDMVVFEGEPAVLRIGESADLAGFEFKISPEKLELREMHD